MSIKLSIVIPCYNAEPYIHELLDCLDKQMTNEVEVILIDDGSDKPVKTEYKWVNLFRQKNGGISKARNKGLNMAKGQFVWFIDADDLIADNAIEYVLKKLDQECDYMDLSWKSLEDNRYTYKLNSDSDGLPNPSASTRIFKRSFIGNVRFNEKKDTAEDEDFTRHLQINKAKHICATEYIYFYRITTPGSKYKMFLEGRTNTKRIGYYYKTVTKDMTYLIDEIKKLDEEHEVMLFTANNQIPELEVYCQIKTPTPINVSEARGEKQHFMKVIPTPIETQVVIYQKDIGEFGGRETFIYSFCKQLSKYYDITVIYDAISTSQLTKISKICLAMRNNPQIPIVCDTLIMNSILDKKPQHIEAKRVVQMVHCIQQGNFQIPKGRDVIVNVSQASKDSFGESSKDGIVIHNLTVEEKPNAALLLVSALRVGAADKQGNDARCIKFANLLKKAQIPFIWIYFGDHPMPKTPPEMIYGGLIQNIKPYVAKADYLVQLSGSEAFSYSLLESLETHTPVIVTPLAQNAEMGIVDGLNSYIVPFEVDGFDVKKILNLPKFEYRHDNAGIVKQWRELLGNTKPKGGYKPKKELEVEVIREYRDVQRGELMKLNSSFIAPYERALELQNLGFVRIIN